jgi:type IV pilus assembly protein PilC
VLQAAQRVGNLEWALDELADASLRRAAYRWQAVVNVLGPLVILFAGLLVGFIVVALFMPLISLIQGLSR